MKILVVDDSATDRFILESYLLDMGHSVVMGKDGGEAVILYQQGGFDLILLDEVMPVKHGTQVAKEIRELEQDDWVPIIFLSGRAKPKDIAYGIEAGGDDYLTKPIDDVILKAKLIAMERIAQMRRKLFDLSQKLAEANKTLTNLADSDGLTGLANRRHLDNQVERELARSVRNQEPISIIMCDIDDFKKFNDYYGHIVGDDCLKKVAQAMAAQAKRATDIVARYGGEEFTIVLPNTALVYARWISEKVRYAVEQLQIPHEFSANRLVTLSMGVYSGIPHPDETCSDILQKADSALYLAKLSGKNQVKTFIDTDSLDQYSA